MMIKWTESEHYEGAYAYFGDTCLGTIALVNRKIDHYEVWLPRTDTYIGVLGKSSAKRIVENELVHHRNLMELKAKQENKMATVQTKVKLEIDITGSPLAVFADVLKRDFEQFIEEKLRCQIYTYEVRATEEELTHGQ